MTHPMPALSLAAVPGRRARALDVAREAERLGFGGIYCPSFGDAMGLCTALASATETIPFGTAITNIYTRNVQDYAQSAAFIHELSGGRFRFGVGVVWANAARSAMHGSLERMAADPGAPVSGTRQHGRPTSTTTVGPVAPNRGARHS